MYACCWAGRGGKAVRLFGVYGGDCRWGWRWRWREEMIFGSECGVRGKINGVGKPVDCFLSLFLFWLFSMPFGQTANTERAPHPAFCFRCFTHSTVFRVSQLGPQRYGEVWVVGILLTYGHLVLRLVKCPYYDLG